MASLPDKFDAKKGDYFWLYPETLTRVTDPQHPLYDQRVNLPFEESWVIAAMNHGMPDPLLVRRDGDNLLIVDGRQRHSAIVEANKRLKKSGAELLRVPVITQRGDEADMIGLIISSNMLRKGNTIADNADLAARFIATGKSAKDASIRFGVSETAVNNWLAYRDLPKVLKKAVDDDILSASAAIGFKNLPAEEIEAKVKTLRESGVKIGREEARAISQGSRGDVPKVKRPGRKAVFGLIERPEIPGEFAAFLQWLRGEMSFEEVLEINPWMKKPEKPEPTGKVKVERKKRKNK